MLRSLTHAFAGPSGAASALTQIAAAGVWPVEALLLSRCQCRSDNICLNKGFSSLEFTLLPVCAQVPLPLQSTSLQPCLEAC